MFHKCKVTVVKRYINKELAFSYLKKSENFSACNIVKDNQEFIVSAPFELPEGLCASAWADIRPFIMTIASGGAFSFFKEKNTALATCTDLFRPVIFKIELIDG